MLAVFGVALVVPQIGDRLERPLAALSRLGPRTRGDGFASGLIVGAALGFVYTPCAGPILAAVISVSAATGRAVAVGLAYALGTGLMLLALALGGRRILDRLRRSGRTLAVQRALGVVMVATAIVLATMLDVRLDQWIANNIPNVNISAFVDDSHAVSKRLADVRPGRAPGSAQPPGADAVPGVTSLSLPDFGPAPAFVGTERWFNTPGGRPLSIRGLRGRVVLIDFWTYTCINCIRTLPYLEAWDAKYRSKGLTIIGIEAPEFPFERSAGNVLDAIHQFGIHYPVVQDNNLDTWNAWGNEYWPADYLIDASGNVRYISIGEGDYGTTQTAIRKLLARAGARRLGADARAHGVITPSQLVTSPRPTSAPPAPTAGSTRRFPARPRLRLPLLPVPARRVRLRRHVVDRPPAGARDLRREDPRKHRGQERLHRALAPGAWCGPASRSQSTGTRRRRST